MIDTPFLQVTPLEFSDFVEAAVRSGHVAEAEPYVQRLEELALANGSPWARAMADRSRALIDDDDPEPLYRAAIASLEPPTSTSSRAGPTCSTASGCVAASAAATHASSFAPPWTSSSAAPHPRSSSGRAPS